MFLSSDEASQPRPSRKMTLQQPDTDPDNTDGRSGFGYSQKFFHISDGNLYSVFSPLQGRCYGVRPAFLRQHSSKSHQHHHSQEQQPGLQNSPPQTSVDEPPPVVRGRGRGHRRGSSATRGRRNRGLKFHNFVPAEKTGPMPAPPDPWSPNLVHTECRLREERGTKQITVSNYWSAEGTRPVSVVPECEASQNVARKVDVDCPPPPPPFPSDTRTQKEQTPSLPVVPESASSSQMDENSDESYPAEPDRRPEPGRIRHRRKPLQTRQVIPYPTYLSMLQDDSPLDLSQASKSPPPPNSTSTLEALLLLNNNNSRDQPSHSRYEIPVQASGSGLQPPVSITRRPSQRTLIRQKLEDTFKQNGFLVKTKQVSDGDATFCKFKQLRKYTRYYLKSWHQHLPEEVHKLWKGFLPPTASPPGGSGVTVQAASPPKSEPKWPEPPS